MGSVFGSAFGTLASGIALRVAVRLLVFVAEATGVSKISSMGVSLGAEFYVSLCSHRLSPSRALHRPLKQESRVHATQTASAIANQHGRGSATP